MSPEFQPFSLQACVQPEDAQTGSVIPRCICVFSLHQAVAGKSPQSALGSGHSLSCAPHAPSLPNVLDRWTDRTALLAAHLGLLPYTEARGRCSLITR